MRILTTPLGFAKLCRDLGNVPKYAEVRSHMGMLIFVVCLTKKETYKLMEKDAETTFDKKYGLSEGIE